MANIYATEVINDDISNCMTIGELKSCTSRMIRSQKEKWKEKIGEIIAEAKCSKSEFAERCGVSRQTLHKWENGAIPNSRETFLKIGMAANYDKAKMNQLLQVYGCYPALYPKSLEDCICIYVIDHDCEKPAELYESILGRIKKELVQDRNDLGIEDISTVRFDSKLSEINSKDELERFIFDNISVFGTAYRKLNSYIMESINANYHYFQDRGYDSINNMEVLQGWSSSLKNSVSEIRNMKWYPTRNKIISLGVHLSMDREQIDDMLKLAHMKGLYAQNLYESIIIFVLENASFEMLEKSLGDGFDPRGLCELTRYVLEKIDLPELQEYILEFQKGEDENYDELFE